MRLNLNKKLDRAGRRAVRAGAAGLVIGVGSSLVLGLVTVGAQDALTGLDSLEGLTVVGSNEAVWDLAGSAAYIDSQQFRDRGYNDINQVLATVPGVYLRQEDGYGNFPNISMRGADGTRASKVTVMEDGILNAPAPYAAPAAYYFPKSGRMSAIEILKGSSQVRYGPQTTGGVLNFLSTPVPGDGGPNFHSRTTGGSDATFFNHTWHGDTIETGFGRWGYLLEFHGQQSDGFREYLAPIGKDSGFRFWEPMFKAFWEIDGSVKQRFEVKFGMTDFHSDEGYLGLSEIDARGNPDGRYAATVFDEMDTRQYRSHLRYLVEPSDSLSIQSTLYWNNFERNWYKLDHAAAARNPAFDSRGRIVGRSSLDTGLLDPGILAVLQGTAPGSIAVKANARYYDAYGWQNQATWRFETGGATHELVGGFRAHYDRVFREQWVDLFNGDGSYGFSPMRRGVPGEEANRLEEATALAFYLEDKIELGKLTLTPGLRYEHVEYDTTDFRGTGVRQSDDFGVWAGGMGFNYAWNDCHSLHGGIFRGFSLPGPNSYVNSGVTEEESLGYEFGWRYRKGGLTIDTAAFFTDFDNLIGVDAGLGLSGGNQNAGAAEVWGMESMITWDPVFDRGLGFRLPMYLSATWTSAELKQSLTTGGSDNIYAGGQPGAEIPYVPEWKLAAGIGYLADGWGVNLDAYYASSTYGTALNSPVPVTSARQGEVDALLTVDLTGYYQLGGNWKLVGGLHNIFDERGVTTRLPAGPRTNLPRTWFAGVEASF